MCSSLILHPLLEFLTTGQIQLALMTPRIENEIFSRAILAVAVPLLLINRSQLNRHLIWSPRILSLAAYMAFAGASVASAYNEEYSLTRHVAQIMLIAPIVLRYAVRMPMTRTIQGTHLRHVAAINVMFVLGTKPTLAYSGEELRRRTQPRQGRPLAKRMPRAFAWCRTGIW